MYILCNNKQFGVSFPVFTLGMLGKFSASIIFKYFSNFSQKIGFDDFYMQIVCQGLFSGKIRKILSICHLQNLP